MMVIIFHLCMFFDDLGIVLFSHVLVYCSKVIKEHALIHLYISVMSAANLCTERRTV